MLLFSVYEIVWIIWCWFVSIWNETVKDIFLDIGKNKSCKRLIHKLLDKEHSYSVSHLPVSIWAFLYSVQFYTQSLSHVRLFATPWITARQASLSITSSLSSLRLRSIESVMPSSHLILCRPLFLLPPIPPSIRVFSNESALRIGWPKYWSFSCSIIPSKEHPGLISFRMDWLDLLTIYLPYI